MPLPADVVAYVTHAFSPGEVAEASAVLENAVLHDGTAPDPRMLRCALVAAQGSLESLRHHADLLAVDYRDVIVAGEYESKAGDWVRVRDLSEPLQ